MATKATTKKTIKRSAPKTSAKPKTSVQSSIVEEPKKNTAPVRVRKSYIIAIIAILALGGLLYAARSVFVAAVVNGQPISRLSIVHEAEKQAGKQALDNMVRNTLIEQEARKKNVTVSDKEIDDEIKKVDANLSKQGRKLDQELAAQGLTQNDLRKLVRINKLLLKLVGDDVKVSDKEITEYLDKNRDLLPQDQTEDQLKKAAAERLKQDKLSQKVTTMLESMQNKAKVLYFVQY